MKYNQYTISVLTLFLCFNSFVINIKAQETKLLNQLLPMDMIDKSESIHKIVGGMGFMVHSDIQTAIKSINSCAAGTYGTLNIELNWYDLNDETAKFTINTMKQLDGVEQEKQNFFENVVTEDFAGGSIIITTKSKPCVNEITGPTGETDHNTSVKYYEFTGSTFIKIAMSAYIKPEIAKSIITKVVEEVKKFDFSVYKNTIADEKG